MRRLWLALALVLWLAIATPAAASVTRHRDGNDSASRLDVRRVSLVARRRGIVTVTIKTFEPINLRAHGQLWAQFDSWGAGGWDYGFHMWWDGGSDGIFCDWRDRVGHVSPQLGWDVEDRTAWCRFDARQLAIRKPVRWRVFSTGILESPEPEPGDILDHAPDGGGWFAGVDLTDRSRRV